MRAQSLAAALFMVCLLWSPSAAQDASAGSLHLEVVDATGAAIANSRVELIPLSTRAGRSLSSLGDALFAAEMLPPDDYEIDVTADGMAPDARVVHIAVGAVLDLRITLKVKSSETVEVRDETPLVETQASSISAVLEEKQITDLPLNGRRFSDLAMLAPGVTADPRGMTSSSIGDLAFGGIRGFQTSFQVDGGDNNNSFFAQARGRYRAPYQFSNETVQEFRVSSNTYGVEQGRSSGAVVNVVTKSGGNFVHGTAFWFLRDSRFNAQHAFTDFKPFDKQHQFGGTLGGPIKKNRAFWYIGFDQHIFHIPTVVRFDNNASTIVPQPIDYEARDRDLVLAAAQQLNQMAGTFRSALVGNAGLAKLDWTITPKYHLVGRVNTSRYWGTNNVYFDPSSPLTTYATSNNGEESVRTETANLALTSGISPRLTSTTRLQFSRDLQASSANSNDVQTKIYDLIDGFGRASILPRQTREHKLHLAQTFHLDGRTHRFKFGGDIAQSWIRNFFPMLFGGEYIFDDVRVNQWTFEPQTYGLELTPLRAFAHDVPRYYVQNFGNAVSHPDTTEYAGFAQDTMRLTGRLALTLGLRYDLQTFRALDEPGNPLWPLAGRMPSDGNNFAPRAGFAYSIGDNRPLVFRGGYGMFYTRIPQIYNSAVETDTGLAQQHLYLNVSDYYDRQLFPAYPQPLVNCGQNTTVCVAPPSVANMLTTEISSFGQNFQIPYVQQASLNVEKEVADKLAAGISYMYVHGSHLIRARDVNLPPPAVESYPVFDPTGQNFTGQYYQVASFTGWTLTRTLACPFPPCMSDLQRPIPQIGSIDSFDSEASSVYHGMTVSLRRRMSHGLYLHAAYTFARAIDDGQDALVAGRPALVQNSYSTVGERSLSSTDQRHRFIVSWIAEPKPFHREHPVLKTIFNDWKWSGLLTFGSGRPVTARLIGDANLDGNTDNDRLPGVSRNAYTGPDYSTTDMRLARQIVVTERLRLELVAESFNLFNRDNKLLDTSDDGFSNTAATFSQIDQTIGGKRYPAVFRQASGFLIPTNAYAPRQIQFAIRARF
jgi:hypothetical protein